MTPKQEILAITELCVDITDLNAGFTIHPAPVGSVAIDVSVFNDNSEIVWTQHAHNWRHDEAYLPKLRFIRGELEQMHKEALAQRMESGV